jgi:hypothetical protein
VNDKFKKLRSYVSVVTECVFVFNSKTNVIMEYYGTALNYNLAMNLMASSLRLC